MQLIDLSFHKIPIFEKYIFMPFLNFLFNYLESDLGISSKYSNSKGMQITHLKFRIKIQQEYPNLVFKIRKKKHKGKRESGTQLFRAGSANATLSMPLPKTNRKLTFFHDGKGDDRDKSTFSCIKDHHKKTPCLVTILIFPTRAERRQYRGAQRRKHKYDVILNNYVTILNDDKTILIKFCIYGNIQICIKSEIDQD